MNTDSKQKKQLIVLCCLAVAVLAFGAYKLVGKGTEAASIEKPAQTVKSDAAGDDAKAVDAAAYQDTMIVAVGPSVDPFAPRVGPKASEAAASSADRGPTPVIQSRIPDIPQIFPVPLYQQDEPRPIVVSTSTPEETNPIQGMRLTGVIEGAQNVAIIRGGDGKRYIVREGQTIDGKCTVSSITRAGVKISRGGTTYTLRLGSSGD